MLHYETIEPKTLGLLRSFSKNPQLAAFQLVGGTALALHLGHRRSVDLEFFYSSRFVSGDILKILEQVFSVELLGQTEGSLNCFLNGVKVDIICHEYDILEQTIVEEGIRLWSVQDIAAAKVSAIVNRGVKKRFLRFCRTYQAFQGGRYYWVLLEKISFRNPISCT